MRPENERMTRGIKQRGSSRRVTTLLRAEGEEEGKGERVRTGVENGLLVYAGREERNRRPRGWQRRRRPGPLVQRQTPSPAFH